MTKVIEVLAHMASNANLQSKQAIESFVTNTEINADQSKAIIANDVLSLERQLNVYRDIVCFLIPAEDGEPVKEEENDEEKTKTVVNW
ncbi:hypothetical protein [Colwellia sp. 12G3]|uniref:hypothetical protein n=1 Tax=Colwellia sp. 12G3 TaxID=2058299 RepID=UPI000C337849|nr:hypothetical protein [Colwellia sp. 12G3]PKI17353.1 hypothetical protein CXF71_05120 [Colwellia sp. 12G3]